MQYIFNLYFITDTAMLICLEAVSELDESWTLSGNSVIQKQLKASH